MCSASISHHAFALLLCCDITAIRAINMIDEKELMKIAKIKAITNKGYAEKDYLQDIFLLLISRNTKDELIFKGGTCLYKFYGLGRFSEDLDFSAIKDINVEILLKSLISGLSVFGIKAEIEEKKYMHDSVLIGIRTYAILYRGTSISASKIRIDINLKSKVYFQKLQSYTSLYYEVPAFHILIMDEAEILAEKIRAIMSRNRARDIYDLWFLLNKNVKIDINLINKKLEYYNKRFNFNQFKEEILKCEKLWKSQMHSLADNIPKFDSVAEEILKKFSENIK